MREKKLVLLGIAFVLSLFSTAYGQPQVKGGSCVSCHASMPIPNLSKPVSEWKASIHYQKDVLCDSCHGGSSLEMDPTKAMDPKLGFVGKVSPVDMPSHCGRCHKTQLEAAAFKESTHYQMAWHGQKAASCPTCHGGGSPHAIVEASFGAIIPKVCQGCHQENDERITLVKEELLALKGNVDAFEKRVRILKKKGMAIGEPLALVTNLRETYLEAVHALGARHVEIQKGIDINTTIAKLDPELKKLEQEAKGRRRLGFGILVFTLAAVGAITLLQRSLPKIKKLP